MSQISADDVADDDAKLEEKVEELVLDNVVARENSS